MKKTLLIPVALAIAAQTMTANAGFLRPAPKERQDVWQTASNCHAIGEQTARQLGGQLAKATESSQGGRPVCVVVVLVPGKGGERPQRREIVVPQ